MRERDRIVAGSYLGEIEFEPDSVGHWFDGAEALQSVSDKLVCFIHPADKTMTDELKGELGSDVLEEFVSEINRKLDVEVLSWEAFDLGPSDFLDVNHMNARGGREKLSRQLAAMLSS